MDKIWDRTYFEVGCGGDEKNEWPRRTDKSRTLKKKINCIVTNLLYVSCMYIIRSRHGLAVSLYFKHPTSDRMRILSVHVRVEEKEKHYFINIYDLIVSFYNYVISFNWHVSLCSLRTNSFYFLLNLGSYNDHADANNDKGRTRSH